MDLFIGGHAQGKYEYAVKKYPDDFRIINDFHLRVKEELAKYTYTAYSEDILAETIFRNLTEGLPVSKTVIISDDIGCGIVPLDRFDRLWRDVTGKVLIKVAEMSDNVYRVICGIVQKIK